MKCIVKQISEIINNDNLQVLTDYITSDAIKFVGGTVEYVQSTNKTTGWFFPTTSEFYSTRDVYVLDVSNMIGSTLKITSAAHYTEGKPSGLFVSSLGGLPIDNPSSVTRSAIYNFTLVQTFEQTTEETTDSTTTIEVLVPQGSSYLLFNNINNICTLPVIEVVL